MKEEKIKVLALLPMELPKEIKLDNTLEAMQKFVGGLIKCITLSDTGSAVTLVCNDEGKLLGLPLNRPLWDGADVLAGPGFLAGCDNEGNLTSLPQSAMDFYKEKFRAFIEKIKKRKLNYAAMRADGKMPREEYQAPVSYTHLRAHETDSYLVCRLLLEKKKCHLYTSPSR